MLESPTPMSAKGLEYKIKVNRNQQKKKSEPPSFIDKVSHVFDETIRHVRPSIVIHKART